MKLLVSWQAKAFFFDRDKVINEIGRDNAKRMSKFGATVRRLAQKSIKIREGPSEPGKPPHGHKTGVVKRRKNGGEKRQSVSLLREFIFFSYEKDTKTVVIGPAKLNSRVSDTALPALEYGGESVINTKRGKKRIFVKARPFMRPAFDEAISQLGSIWRL